MASCCCTTACRYTKRNKRLQKKALQTLRQCDVVSSNGLPSTQLLQSKNAPQSAKAEITLEISEIEALRQRAYKKARCGKCCYVTWWLTSLVYVAAIITVGVAIQSTLKLPTQTADFVNKQSKSVSQVVDLLANSVDSAVNQILGQNFFVLKNFVNGTDQEYVASINQMKSVLESGQFISQLTSSFDGLMNQVFNGLSGAFKFSADPAYADAKAAISRLFADFKGLDGKLQTLATAINSLSDDVKAKLQIPANIPASIAAVAGADYQDIVDVFLGPIPTYEKFMCTLKGLKLFQAISLPAELMSLLFPYDASCNKIAVDYNQVVGMNLLGELNTQLQTLGGYLDSLSSTVVLNFKAWIPLVYQLQTLNITTLFQQMQLGENGQPTCAMPWCGLLPYNCFSEYSQEIQAVMPDFAKGLFNFTAAPEAINNFAPFLYVAVLFVPVLIIIVTWVCMSCKCTCASNCSIWCCPLMNWCVALTSMFMLLITLVSSGVITPLFTELSTDLTKFTDFSMGVTQKLGWYDPALLQAQLPGVLLTTPIGVQVLPGLNLSTTKSTLESFKMQLQIVPSQILSSSIPTQALDSTMTSLLKLLGLKLPTGTVGDLITPIGAYLDTAFAAYANMTVSFADTDFSHFFDISLEKALLGMFKVNNQTVGAFAKTLYQTLLNAVLKDTLDVIKPVFNVDPKPVINSDTQAFLQSMGIDLSFTVDVSQFQSAYQQMISMQAQTVDESKVAAFYDSVTSGLTTGSAPTINVDQNLMTLISLLLFVDQEHDFVTGTVPVSPVLSANKQKLLPQNGDFQKVLDDFRGLKKQATLDWVNLFAAMDCDAASASPVYPADFNARLTQRGVSVNSMAFAMGQYHRGHCQVIKQLQTQIQSNGYTQSFDLLGSVYDLLNIQKVQNTLSQIYSYIVEGTGLDGTTANGFLPQLNSLVTAVSKGVFLAASQQISPVGAGLLQNSFSSSQTLSRLNAFVQNTLGAALYLLFAETSPVSTKLAGMVTQLPQDIGQLAFGWLDLYSFAFYLLFLYYFFGPMFMAFSHAYVKLTGADKRLCKKYHVATIKVGQQYQPLLAPPKLTRAQMYEAQMEQPPQQFIQVAMVNGQAIPIQQIPVMPQRVE